MFADLCAFTSADAERMCKEHPPRVAPKAEVVAASAPNITIGKIASAHKPCANCEDLPEALIARNCVGKVSGSGFLSRRFYRSRIRIRSLPLGAASEIQDEDHDWQTWQLVSELLEDSMMEYRACEIPRQAPCQVVAVTLGESSDGELNNSSSQRIGHHSRRQSIRSWNARCPRWVHHGWMSILMCMQLWITKLLAFFCWKSQNRCRGQHGPEQWQAMGQLQVFQQRVQSRRHTAERLPRTNIAEVSQWDQRQIMIWTSWRTAVCDHSSHLGVGSVTV